jgi:hypothetical protein
LGPVKDPWFQALVPLEVYGGDLTGSQWNQTVYVSALPASPMGCITRYQWCKNNGKVCTDLTGQVVGGRDAAKEAIKQEIRLNSRQKAIVDRLFSYVWSKSPNKHILYQWVRKLQPYNNFMHWITSAFMLDWKGSTC